MVEELRRGTRSRVVRHGDRVRRSRSSPASPYAHPTLRLLAEQDWPGAPRVLAEGPIEELTFLPGIVPERDAVPGWARRPAALTVFGRLARELHDLTAGSELAGDAETVCHNDLGPSNTVHDPDTLLPYAFIDWDETAPGDRLDDLGHAAWQCLGLGPGADEHESAVGIAALLNGYGDRLTATDVVSAAVAWQHRTADGIEAGAASDSTLASLVAAGVPDACRAAAEWTATRRDALVLG